jgi:pSer/pThr/pTyr-binding forkhead associated (FHA) protein
LNGKQTLCIPVGEAGASIGREADNHVQLLRPEVSKRHAHLQPTPAGWRIRDLNSRNGLLVNGRRVQEAVLRSGDQLTIGPYTVVFELVDANRPFTPRMELDVSRQAQEKTMGN